MHTYNSSPWKSKSGTVPRITSQPGLYCEHRPAIAGSQDLASENKRRRDEGREETHLGKRL